jgi:hypothetical protein
MKRSDPSKCSQLTHCSPFCRTLAVREKLSTERQRELKVKEKYGSELSFCNPSLRDCPHRPDPLGLSGARRKHPLQDGSFTRLANCRSIHGRHSIMSIIGKFGLLISSLILVRATHARAQEEHLRQEESPRLAQTGNPNKGSRAGLA